MGLILGYFQGVGAFETALQLHPLSVVTEVCGSSKKLDAVASGKKSVIASKSEVLQRPKVSILYL